MADEEVRLTASMNDDLSAALDRISRRLDEVERKLLEVAAAGKTMGKDVDDGAGDAEKSVKGLGDEADKTKPKIKGLGDEVVRTGTKSKRASTDFDVFGKKLDKLGKKAGGVGSILQAYKWAGIATGIFAIAGGLSALGAGALIAVGGLMPMIGVLAGIAPLMLALKLSTLLFKLAADQLSGPLARMKQQFLDLGQQIADGGLAEGLDYMASSMFDFSKLTGKGLTGLGAEIGMAAHETGNWIASEPFLSQIARIFDGMRPIVGALARGVIMLARGLLHFLEATLPLGRAMAEMFYTIMEGFANWMQVQNESGKAQAALLRSWNLFRRVVGTLVDVLIGVFNLLRIGGTYSREMGLGIESAARNFRTWTGTAEGQARINKYFQDSLPALREMSKLIGMLLGGLGKLGASQDIAPLLNQIRTELSPAIGQLVTNMAGQGGLGPALIDAATALALLFANLDFSGLTLFAEAVGSVARGILWMNQNVPGANFAFSVLLGTMLGFKLMGPIFSMLGNGIKAFGWVWTAIRGVAGLSAAQKVFKLGASLLLNVFSAVGKGIIFVIRAIGIAMMSNPIIAAIMIIIGILLYLWFNCEWFRDGVIKIWEVISAAAVVAWNWVSDVVGAAISWIADKATWLWENAIQPVWQIISTAAQIYWNAWVAIITTAIDVIVTVVTWLWENVIRPVWELIATVATVYWNVMMFVVKTVIYIIIGIIYILAKIAEAIWEGIKEKFLTAVAGILIAVQFFRDLWNTVTSWIGEKWTQAIDTITAVWNLLWATYVQPKLDWISAVWTRMTEIISEKWNAAITIISGVWNALWAVYVQPKIDWLIDKWNWLTTFIGLMWDVAVKIISDRWQGFADGVGGVIDWIKGVWESGTSWMADFFSPVGDAIGAIFDGIGSAASRVAEIVSGAWNGLKDIIKGIWNWIAGKWNSLPTITVPDWVPGIGGTKWDAPKLPTLWHGGPTPGGMAVVGEHGPEPLVRNGRIVGMLGANGPELANLPRGGYVVPNISTLTKFPGLAKSIPSSVAAAVAAGMPSAPARRGGGTDAALVGAIRELVGAVRSQTPPITVGSEDAKAAVLDALRTRDREVAVRGRYSYQAGRG